MPSYNLILNAKEEVIPIDEIHFSPENKATLNQLLDEFKYFEALKKLDLPIDNKILLHGHTGCGKTATAKAIAKALNKRIIILNLGEFISARLGETGRNVTNVFGQAARGKVVLFIDEFDSVGKARDYEEKGGSGEMKRLVNIVIQQIDNLSNDVLLICATNYLDIIDTAILRRFQLKLQFDLPNRAALDKYYEELLSKYPKEFQKIKRTYKISYAEAKDLVVSAIKKQVINREQLKEAQQKHYLFSYGTLQQKNVQKETYGRLLNGDKATLPNYKIEQLEITDKEVLATSGKKFHPIAVQTNNPKDKIAGTIFEITNQELIATDKYEVADYQRVLGLFASGKEAWVYVAKK